MTQRESDLSESSGASAGTPRAVYSSSPSRMGETTRRVLTAVPFVPALLWLFFSGPHLALVLWNVVGAGLAARELLALVALARHDVWIGAALTTVFSAALALGAPPLAVLAVGLVGAAATAMLLDDPAVARASRFFAILGAMLYIGLPLALLSRVHGHPQGGAYVLFAALTAFLADTGAYFGGRFFGRTKLAPRLSPGKTREGALAGLVVGATSGAVVLVVATATPTLLAIAFAVACTAVGQCGDLFESAIKRGFGARESGALLPGHGGLLDRLDAVIATSVFTYFITSGASP